MTDGDALAMERETVTASDGGPEGCREAVGVIYGNVGSTEFRFAVRDPSLKRNDYVSVAHGGVGEVLAQVTDVTRETDLSFDEARALADAQDDVEAREMMDRLTAHAKVVGYRDDRGLLQSPSTPFRAGSVVRPADPSLIARVFGLPSRNPTDGSGGEGDDGEEEDADRPEGAYVGHVKDYGIPVVLDPSVLVQKHVSVLAKTGAGKSYAVGVVMEELAKQGVPIVVLDPHGEHGSLGFPNREESDFPAMRRFGIKPRAYAQRIQHWSPDTLANPEAGALRLDGRDLTTNELEDLVGQRLTNTQAGILHQGIQHLRETTRTYTLEDIIDEVREHESSAKWNLVNALESLLTMGLFEGEGTPPGSLVKPGRLSVVNLRGAPPHVQEIVVARLTKGLFEARKRGEVPPFMLVVEEAHNYCPERTFKTALSGDVLRTVASEGRKFGMGLTVISQRPAKVDKNVLSQCNTEIILKVTNPNDLKALVASVEGLTSDMEDEIQRLPVGTAVVSHPPIAMPLLVEVRPRETRHGGRSVDVLAGPDAADRELEGPQAVDVEEEAGALEGGAGVVEQEPVDMDGDPDEDAEDEVPADPPTTVEVALVEASEEIAPPGTHAPDPPELAHEVAPEDIGEGSLEPVLPQPSVDAEARPTPRTGDPAGEAEPAPQPEAAPTPEPEDAPHEVVELITPEGEPVGSLEVGAPEAPAREPGTTEPGATEPHATFTPVATHRSPGADPLPNPQHEPQATREAEDARHPEPTSDPTPLSPEVANLVLAARDAANALAERDPRKLDRDRVARLVEEVDGILHLLERLDRRHPDIAGAHGDLAEEALRYQRALEGGPEPKSQGLVARLLGR